MDAFEQKLQIDEGYSIAHVKLFSFVCLLFKVVIDIYFCSGFV